MKKPKAVIVLMILVYLVTRLLNLTILPVFADEAIYIRWAQLINQDFQRYVFFPLQDGKPPLMMLLLTKFLTLNPLDPLWASRLMSVLFGLVSMGLVGYITGQLANNKLSPWLAMGFYLILPYSLFYDRMGLIDPMVMTFLAVMMVGWIRVMQHKGGGAFLLGVGWGLALWTKTSALFLGLPIFWLTLIRVVENRNLETVKIIMKVGLGLMAGLLIFGSLRISSSFPALFTRSSDFSFGLRDIWLGQTSHIWGNILTFSKWMGMYLTGFLWIGVGLGLLITRSAKKDKWLRYWLMAGLMYLLPFVVFGRVVASRYLLPVVIFIIPVAAAALAEIFSRKKWWFGLLVAGIVVQAGYFDIKALTDPASLPIPHEDEVQYLTEWSSGYGIPEVRDFISSKAEEEKVTVATEGYFGTLPDGLLMYFDKSPLIRNLEIYGIGQPVQDLPDELIENASNNATYLVVNSHRFLIPLPHQNLELIASYPRPRNGPELLLLKIIPKI